MPPRYTVKAQSAPDRYCIWDRETEDIAVSSDERQCWNLRLSDAFRPATKLNQAAESQRRSLRGRDDSAAAK